MSSINVQTNTLGSVLRSWSPLIILLYCILYYFFGEHVNAGDGYGWDGQGYSLYAQHFLTILRGPGVDDYHATRLFPMFVINGFSHLLHYPLTTPKRTILAFVIYNTLLLTGAGWLWLQIAKHKEFSDKIFWIGFFSLFVNFSVLKDSGYAPVGTDVSAFFFGVLLFYFYVIEKPLLICIAVFFAANCWPTVIYFTFPLIFTKNSNLILKPRLLDLLISYVGLGIYSIGVGYYIINFPAGSANILLYFSAILVELYVFYVIKNSFFVSTSWSYVTTTSRIYNPYITYYLISAGLYFILLHLIQHFYGTPAVYNFVEYLPRMFSSPIVFPGIFIVAHITYYGPLIILLILSMNSIFKEALSESFGIYLFLILTFLIMLDPESRHALFSYPILVYLVCKCLREREFNISWNFVGMYGFTCLLLSKFYLPIHVPASLANSSNITSFPWERYFMNFGPWMSGEGYIVNLIFIMIAVISLLPFLIRLFNFNRAWIRSQPNYIVYSKE